MLPTMQIGTEGFPCSPWGNQELGQQIELIMDSFPQLDPLFKGPNQPISPQEEADITQKLSIAYKNSEHGVQSPELCRISHSIVKLLEHNDCKG